jgi:hypothetical protein
LKGDAPHPKLQSPQPEMQMNHTADMGAATAASYALCYQSLSHFGRGFSFPCDMHGHVAIDELSERALNNYLYARAMVGKELLWPRVSCCA